MICDDVKCHNLSYSYSYILIWVNLHNPVRVGETQRNGESYFASRIARAPSRLVAGACAQADDGADDMDWRGGDKNKRSARGMGGAYQRIT